MVKLQEKYAKEGFQLAFLTKTYGFFEDKENLSAEDEIAADKKYWVDDHKMSFKIAVDVVPPNPDSANAALHHRRMPSMNFEKYGILYVPTMALIDRSGVTRYVRIGGGDDLEAVLTKEIERLLAEKAAGTK